MADRSKIEWTDRHDWNPIRGCTRVSEGCRNCYAEEIAARFSGPGKPFHGFAERTPNGPRWTGRIELIEDRLTLPLTWRKPVKIFVNSASDLFHESIPDEWLDRIFAVMALAPQHTFQLLTKRPKRMREYFEGNVDQTRRSIVNNTCFGISQRLGARFTDEQCHIRRWPLPNVWLGVTAEDQENADARIPDLLATPAAIRFVSCEPMLSEVDIDLWLRLSPSAAFLAGRVTSEMPDWTRFGTTKLDWVIAGGESGPHARPSHPDWFRSLRDQCAPAGVAFLLKQWGGWMPTSSVDTYSHGRDRKRQYPNAQGIAWLADGRICLRDYSVSEHRRRIAAGVAANSRAVEVDHDALNAFTSMLKDEARAGGGNPLGFQWMYRVGKKRSGRLLDGVEHNEFPKVRP